MRIELERRVEPVHGALPGVGVYRGWSSGCLDLALMQVLELALDLLLGSCRGQIAKAFAGIVVAERDGADVALVATLSQEMPLSPRSRRPCAAGASVQHRRYSYSLGPIPRFPILRQDVPATS